MKKLSYSILLILCFTTNLSYGKAPEQKSSVIKLFQVMGIDEQLSSGFEAMLPLVDQLALQLQLDTDGKDELKEIYRSWFDNDIDREQIKSRFIQVYEDAFSEREIKEIIKFYESPIGQKFLTTSPELMRLGAEIGMQEAQSKQQELMNRLQPFLSKHRKQ